MPRLAVACVLLALIAVAGTSTYAGYLVVTTVAATLGTERFVAGLLLGALFARLPLIRQGKLRTVGLLPKKARLPVIVGLLALCLMSYLYRGDYVPVLFLSIAVLFLLAFRWMRQTLVSRALSIFKKPGSPTRSGSPDPTVIDGDFREKKD